MTRQRSKSTMLSVIALALCLALPVPALAAGETIQWLNHLGFQPGDPSVATSFNAVDSEVGTGLSGLIVTSTTTGDTAVGGGMKAVEMGAPVPPGFLVTGVRVCYELSSSGSFITQVRLAQLLDPPAFALVKLDDGTDLAGPGPVCVNSALPPAGPIDPAAGALRLDLGLNFANIADRIVIRGVGLVTVPDPNSPVAQALAQMQTSITSLTTRVSTLEAEVDVLQADMADLEYGLLHHTHTYLTGIGVGHNNTTAYTGSTAIAPPPVIWPPVTPPPVTPPPVTPPKKGGKK